MTETSTGFPAEAFIAVGDRPGIAWAEIQRMQAEVSALQEKGVDLIVVALHGGREYWERPTEFQQQAAHALIDAGADLVWGHHAHSWQGIEFYGDGVALYSLGDFVFDQMTTNDTAVAHIWLDRDGVRQIALSPVHIVENGRPTPAKGRQGRAILDWLYGLTALIQE
jgi:poly-gamma-glutamate synthesis protein (capsule biosynthesis protein)